jgi:hypothetical protein
MGRGVQREREVDEKYEWFPIVLWGKGKDIVVEANEEDKT